MYNERQKSDFIKDKCKGEATSEYYKKLFEVCASFEEEFGGDLCTMPEENVRPILEAISVVGEVSDKQRLTHLQKYATWCLLNNIPDARDDILKIQAQKRAQKYPKIRTTMVSGPIHLQKYLDTICYPESGNTLDCIYRCYYWLAFSGMPEEDILDVRTGDVDFKNMEVHYNGKDYPIYREGIAAFKNAANLREFVYPHPLYSKIVIKNRINGDKLFRGVRGMYTLSSMRVELSRRGREAENSGKTEIKLSYYRAWLSGLFYRMYERECAGFKVSFISAAAEYMSGRVYKLDRSNVTPKSKQKDIARKYENDYDHWKIVFMR